jgi:hypothetical protein
MMRTSRVAVAETSWQPPGWCLILLTGFVTIIALAAVALATIFVSKSLSTGEPHLVMAAALWLLYMVVTVTCFKSLSDWIKNPLMRETGLKDPSSE